MLKKLLIIVVAIVVVLTTTFFFVSSAYKDNIVTINSQDVEFVVSEGDSVSSVITNLIDQDIVKSEFYTKLFVKKEGYSNVMAGTYLIAANSNLSTVFHNFEIGAVTRKTVLVTFIEGHTVVDFAQTFADAANLPELADQLLSYWAKPEYLNRLIEQYDFIDESILNTELYYPLEGYLAPETYEFYVDELNEQNIEQLTAKLLDQRGVELQAAHFDATFNEHITNDFELLTLASIVERESLNAQDQIMIAGVFMNRLELGMSLGSDVTTYYGLKLDLSERDLTVEELNEVNGYNTRSSMIGLPIGPINNPSGITVYNTLNYTSHDYLYFVSDINGKIYYSKTQAEHDETIEQLKEDGLWFTY